MAENSLPFRITNTTGLKFDLLTGEYLVKSHVSQWLRTGIEKTFSGEVPISYVHHSNLMGRATFQTKVGSKTVKFQITLTDCSDQLNGCRAKLEIASDYNKLVFQLATHIDSDIVSETEFKSSVSTTIKQHECVSVGYIYNSTVLRYPTMLTINMQLYK
eukprot:403336242